MQQIYLQDQLYYKVKKIRVSSPDEEALRRFDGVCRFDQAKSKGLSPVDAAKVVGIPRSTLYKWHKKKSINLDTLRSQSRRPKRMRKGRDMSAIHIRVQELRKEFPRWGKRKITKLLKREGISISESSTGRIISVLLKRGIIPSAKQSDRNHFRNPKPQRPYAIKLKRGQKLIAQNPGDAIQIDHMSVHMKAG